MKSSAFVRKISNQSSREIFDKCFHLYRLDSSLVMFFIFVCTFQFNQGMFFLQVLDDFKYMFQDIDYQALEKKWDGIQKKPFEIHRIILDRSVDAYHRDDSVHNFLTFLKLFPTHKCKFECSVQSLIVFSGVRIRFTGNFLTCQFVYVLFFKISYSIYFRILQSMRKVLSTKSPNFHISFASIRRHRKNRSSTWLFRKVS